MIYQIRSYLKFLSHSTNQHGVHSPFVYDLITQCFYDKTEYPEYEVLKAFRKTLTRDNTVLDVTDFGAGSRVFSAAHRRVSHIARNAGISGKRQKLLFRLTRYLRPNMILELGTSLGLATVALGLASEDAQIISVEGCPNTIERAKEALDPLVFKTIKLRNESFDAFLESLDLANFELIYVDGDHDKLNTLRYFEHLLKYVSNDSVIIFDDIYWSPGMTEAWQEIVAHEKVTVSIDTFHWGLVFFRKEQQKEHFIIRL